MTRCPPAKLWVIGLVAVTACMRPAEERARLDALVGEARGFGLSVRVQEGLAAITSFEDHAVILWAQAPGLTVELASGREALGFWEISIQNIPSNVQVTARDSNGQDMAVNIEREATTCHLHLEFGVEETSEVTVSLPRSSEAKPFRFGVVSDIQESVGTVYEVFDAINAVEDLSFVVSAGDLAIRGKAAELHRFKEELSGLNVPFYSAPGNHDVHFFSSSSAWHDVMGRHNFFFDALRTRFLFLDSASATVDPLAYEWLESWLAPCSGELCVFVCHIPPIDPSGIRNGAFGSRKEAAALLAKLARAGVDLTLYGHIHSFHAFSNAGIPAYISGGGGAIPEKLDHIGRHFLVVNVDPKEQNFDVERVDVD